MKSFFGAILCLLSITSFSQNTKLWYTHPAINWNEALPIGNGRLGAMLHGGVATDKIQLNEETLWSGEPRDGNNPAAKEYLPGVRAAAIAGNYKLADSLSKFMQGPYTESYMPMADIIIRHPVISDSVDYRRELDLDKAVASVIFRDKRVKYQREAFASKPNNVIAVHYTASVKNSISLSLSITSKLRYGVKVVSPTHLVLTGKAPRHVVPAYVWQVKGDKAVQYDTTDAKEGMTFEVHVLIVQKSGSIKSVDRSLVITDADEVTLLISAATSFNGFKRSPSREGRSTASSQIDVEKAARLTFEQLKKNHIGDYQPLFRRVSYHLGDSRNAELPTDEKLKKMSEYVDPELVATIAQFGRYLLIAGSRPGGQPLNLKGIWNERLRPEYSSNWCIDHDAQMFYYGAESGNLSEMHEPFLELISELSENGRTTARVNYGMNGWCAHHNTDIWRASNPVGNWGEGNPHWATWNMSGPWLSAHLYDHYLFTGDKQFLKDKAWPVMKGAAEFCMDWLMTDQDGVKLSVPSVSPENTFITARGDTAQISRNSTSDISLMKELFRNCISASTILGVDEKFRGSLRSALSAMPEYKIGSGGQLLEWEQEWKSADPAHRHLSHLYPVFPGNEINPAHTPTLATAARLAMPLRTKTNCSWGFAWKAACWVRLLEADSAWQTWKYQLRYVDPRSTSSVNNYGLFPNLFNSDGRDVIMNGNGCATAVLNEMLMQSHAGEISLLPAVPQWMEVGEVRGLYARGGFVVDIKWMKGKLVQGSVLSRLGGECRVRSEQPIKVSFHGKNIQVKRSDDSVYTFATVKDARYDLATAN